MRITSQLILPAEIQWIWRGWKEVGSIKHFGAISVLLNQGVGGSWSARKCFEEYCEIPGSMYVQAHGPCLAILTFPFLSAYPLFKELNTVINIFLNSVPFNSQKSWRADLSLRRGAMSLKKLSNLTPIPYTSWSSLASTETVSI